MSRQCWMVDMTQFILWSTPGKLSGLKASFKYMTKKYIFKNEKLSGKMFRDKVLYFEAR